MVVLHKEAKYTINDKPSPFVEPDYVHSTRQLLLAIKFDEEC